MIQSISALAALDLRCWRRSPWAIVSSLVPPTCMAVLLAVLTLSVGRQPVALVVEDRSASAAAMEQIIVADDEAYALTQTDAATASRLLHDQDVAAVIVIPPGFGNAVDTHQATLDLTLNNVDVDFADDIRRTVARSVAEFDAPQLGIQGELGGPSRGVLIPNPYRVAVAESNLRDTNVDFLRYQVLPAVVLLVLSTALMGTALHGARDCERGTARHLLLAPVPPIVLVVGRLVGGLLVSMAAVVPMLVLGTITGVIAPPVQHWPILVVLLTFTALCAAGLGAAVGSWLRRTRTVAMTVSIISIYLFFLGGGFTTIAFLPDWLRRLSDFVPTRYAIDGLRQILFYPEIHGVGIDIAVLATTALVAVLVGAIAVRRSWSST
jgi:ABC-2 type transport system permease protein